MCSKKQIALYWEQFEFEFEFEFQIPLRSVWIKFGSIQGWEKPLNLLASSMPTLLQK